ncbi:hypothetical protein MNB_SV-12-1218 [hydrothermal vent metagenome]|uniref:Uncharacterized protein n=1 Tax=hydrothermal vent metagenome TaxID=652676 RepID=A0A1W1CHS5_9ZZZZ
MTEVKSLLDNSKTIMAGVVGFLIVIPSVINSIGDIITSFRNLPIGEKEKIHVQLLEEHWKENPVYTKQMQIDGKEGNLIMTLDIYGNGDIRVDYGEYAQWFPYKKVKNNDKKLTQSFFTNLYADSDIEVFKVKEITTEVENIETQQNIIRIRKFSDGSTQKITLEKNTGKILRVDINESNNSSIDDNATIETIRLPKEDSPKAIHQSKDSIEVIKLPN